nr:hypothetical protein [Sinorhizobium sp. BG8]
MSFLLLSGLQILNSHPALYWGKYGADYDPAFISIEAVEDGTQLRGLSHVGALTLNTSGVLGVPQMNGIPRRVRFPPG